MSGNCNIYNRKDFSSFSNCDEIVSTSLNLDWDLDFEKQRISGSAEHIVKVLKDGCDHCDFDSSHLNLEPEVVINDELVPGSLTIFDTHDVLGTKLSVKIPAHLRSKGSTFSIKFSYFVDANSSAVQWLPASATKGQVYPFIFTQSQAIHARSLFPCMDSPGIKMPYNAKVSAPNWCTVLMSALSDNALSALNGDDQNSMKSTCYWTQPVPTPAYLVALAAGNLAFRDISDRVRIWSEPEIVDSAYYEFSETEQFLAAAESLTCPYQWTRYDVLCLPPSFPYGGMENPCLTFATPTLLAGDKSLADVIAHEIAHSWTGNLVTNHTWDHFWLNEGWTVWLERKITSRVKNNAEFGKLSAQIGFTHLRDDVSRFGECNGFTQLVWPLNGEDPDDAFSSVPYEKGFLLLNMLEGLVGSDLFSLFVKAYIEKYKFSTVTSGEFKDFFLSYFNSLLAPSNASQTGSAKPTPQKGKRKNNYAKAQNGGSSSIVVTPSSSAAAAGLSSPLNKKSSTNDALSTTLSAAKAATILAALNALDWDALLLTPGMPKLNPAPNFSNSLSSSATSLAKKWMKYSATPLSLQGVVVSPDKASSNTMKTWVTNQKCIFLEQLIDHCDESDTPFSIAFLRELDGLYGWSGSKNSEIMFRWQSLCLRSNDPAILPQVQSFITSQGRMKFVRPLYRALRASSNGKQLAVTIFEQHKDSYHPIARKMIKTDLEHANATDPISIGSAKQPATNLAAEKDDTMVVQNGKSAYTPSEIGSDALHYLDRTHDDDDNYAANWKKDWKGVDADRSELEIVLAEELQDVKRQEKEQGLRTTTAPDDSSVIQVGNAKKIQKSMSASIDPQHTSSYGMSTTKPAHPATLDPESFGLQSRSVDWTPQVVPYDNDKNQAAAAQALWNKSRTERESVDREELAKVLSREIDEVNAAKSIEDIAGFTRDAEPNAATTVNDGFSMSSSSLVAGAFGAAALTMLAFHLLSRK